MKDPQHARSSLFENDTTINAFPDGQSSDSDGSDTDDDSKPDPGDQ